MSHPLPVLDSPQGRFSLQRYPRPKLAPGKQEPLRAWDAADEYLLQWLFETQPAVASPATLVLNDSFGALTVALAGERLWSQTDSWLARQGCIENLRANQCPMDTDHLLNSLHWPTEILSLVVIKIPKTLALLEHQLYQLRPLITDRTVIVAGAMVKQLPATAQGLFERILGPTHSTLARKKARLLICQPQIGQWQQRQQTTPYPTQYRVAEFPFVIHNHANVFSRASLDIGCRFFLQHLPDAAALPAKDIVDLGCGNGLLGIHVKSLQPQARIHFVDESFMAVDSARKNVESAGESFIPSPLQQPEDYHFSVGNSLQQFDKNSADLVLNNPPFHQQTVVGDHIAWQMFTDARRVLRPAGELWVVGNRHLNYHNKLKRLFGNCDTVAANRKFVILRSRKQA